MDFSYVKSSRPKKDRVAIVLESTTGNLNDMHALLMLVAGNKQPGIKNFDENLIAFQNIIKNISNQLD